MDRGVPRVLHAELAQCLGGLAGKCHAMSGRRTAVPTGIVGIIGDDAHAPPAVFAAPPACATEFRRTGWEVAALGSPVN